MKPEPTPPAVPIILFLSLLAAVVSDPTVRTVLAAISHAGRVGK